MFEAYVRSVDNGAGRQTVLVVDGKIVSQKLGPKPGLHHSYTGDGNPEWVGQDKSMIRGHGFTRLVGQHLYDLELEYLQSEAEM